MTESRTSNQSDEALPLVERLNLACVASCDCLVKTPVVRYHKPLCKYRVMQEAAQVLSALTPVYETLMIGVAVRTPSTLLVNVQNAFRRSNCLSAIEREFFTREVEDDGSDEMIEDCPMNWGAEPAEYVKQFRDALAELRTAEPPKVIRTTDATLNAGLDQLRAIANGQVLKISPLQARLILDYVSHAEPSDTDHCHADPIHCTPECRLKTCDHAWDFNYVPPQCAFGCGATLEALDAPAVTKSAGEKYVACDGCGIEATGRCPHCQALSCDGCATCEHHPGGSPEWRRPVETDGGRS